LKSIGTGNQHIGKTLISPESSMNPLQLRPKTPGRA
jgi:hypothetical protein